MYGCRINMFHYLHIEVLVFVRKNTFMVISKNLTNMILEHLKYNKGAF